MADHNSGPNWTDAQWEKVNNAVTEAFDKASVAGAFIPCYGPLPESAEYVRNEFLGLNANKNLVVNDDTTLKLFNVTVKVELSSEQVNENALSTALLAFRRAANTLAQHEDDIVFNGYGTTRSTNARGLPSHSFPPVTATTPSVTVSGEASATGLISAAAAKQIATSVTSLQKLFTSKMSLRQKQDVVGEDLVSQVASAVVQLETDFHPGPFACILGTDAFVAAHRPQSGTLVLPSDRITPILNGPLLRAGKMPAEFGIVVSLAGSDIDLVVATPPRTQFLQMNSDAKYLFRVYVKFMLRIKDQTGVQGIGISY